MEEEEKSAFDKMFDQLGDLVKFLEQHAHKSVDESKITPDVQEKLIKLERDVDEFKKISNMIVSLGDVTGEELKKRLAGVSDTISPQGKQLIEKGRRLKSDIVTLSDKLNLDEVVAPPEDIPKTPAPEKEENAEDQKRATKRRRRKFRGME